MTPQGIRKASWFAYKYLAELGDRELQTSDATSIATLKGRTLQLLAWREVLPEQPVSNRPFFTKVRPAAVTTPLTLRVHPAPPRTSTHIRPFRPPFPLARSGRSFIDTAAV